MKVIWYPIKTTLNVKEVPVATSARKRDTQHEHDEAEPLLFHRNSVAQTTYGTAEQSGSSSYIGRAHGNRQGESSTGGPLNSGRVMREKTQEEKALEKMRSRPLILLKDGTYAFKDQIAGRKLYKI
jgi:hypothetical protein